MDNLIDLDPSWYEDWDDEYANAPYIPGASDYPDRWAGDASTFRTSLGDRAELDVAYGAHPRERFDLFMPEGSPAGLVVFVHGGYWVRFDKSDWSHLAAGPIGRGWAVAMPSYVLAPEATITEIGLQMAAAVQALAQRFSGPLALTGHSAGGHLVTRLVAEEDLLPSETVERIKAVVSISGVHDLRPLMLTSMNTTLGLTDREAQAESPALRQPLDGPTVTCLVGGRERPEFVRQSELLAAAWSSDDRPVGCVIEADRHHFDIIELLADPDSALVRTLVSHVE